jgi:MFS family permease
MAGMTGGMVLGFLLSSVVKIPPASRFRIFAFCAYVQGVGMALIPQAGKFGPMVAIGVLSGMANAVLNSFIMAIIQMTVPRTMLGKASSLLMTLSGGLMPLSMAVGGVLAGYIPIRLLISGSFAVMLICATPLMFSRAFHRFINFDPEKQTPESLMD